MFGISSPLPLVSSKGAKDCAAGADRSQRFRRYLESRRYPFLAVGRCGRVVQATVEGRCGNHQREGQDFLRELVVLVGAQNNKDEVAQVVRFLAEVKQPALSFAMVRALNDGLQRAGVPLSSAGGNVPGIISAAAKSANDPQADERTRVQAVRLLGVTSFKESGAELLELLNLSQPQAVQLAAISTLSRFNRP